MADDPKDPRFRRFRVVTLAVYLILVCGFSGMIIFSVFRSVIAMSPKAPNVGQTLPVQQCVAELRVLFDELDSRQRGVSNEPSVATSDVRWSKFRLGWLTRSKQLEALCDLNEPTREPLKKAFKLVDSVVDLYTVHAVQFAGEIGPTLDATRVALDEASK